MSPDAHHPPLSACALGVAVPGRALVEHLELAVQGGEFIAVLGRNGAGKTLTLETLAGLREPDAGRVLLDGSDMTGLHRRDVARRLALLPQLVEDIFPATVLDTVLIGRHPHVGRLRWESAADIGIARDALRTVDLYALADRDVLTLSGGERRRVAIAQALAQAPHIYLLDEPTNHLDPQHQLDAMRVFRGAANNGAAVIASLHDVNLAARFADRCLLLFGDGRWHLGNTADVLTEAALSELFATPMEAVAWRSRQLFVAAGGQPSSGNEAF